MGYLIFRLLPSWAPMAGLTLGHHVFLKATAGEAVSEHELVHVAQQERDGAWRFYVRYLFSARWRVRYESEAYAVQARAGVPVERLAATLAGPLYLWPTSRWLTEAAIRRWL
jgi:hypothetical protein